MHFPIGTGQRFLFVDDNKIARDVATRQFDKLGRECDTAASGAEALQLIQVHDYGAVFTDITMPGMDGIELTSQLRKREAESGQRIPIIAVTGHVSLEDRKRFLAAGMDDVIVKPVTVEQLRVIVSDAAETVRLKDSSPSPIDMAQLAEILGEDDPDEMAAHITLFLEHFPELLKDLEIAVKIKDRQLIRDSAHAAKSAASYTAAIDLSSMLQNMEKLAPDGQLSDLRNLLKDIKTTFKAIEDFSTSLRH